MIVPKILVDGSYQPDLSGVDESKHCLLGYVLNDDGETYTLEYENIDKKREAYELEVGHLVQQYKRYEILQEFEELESIAEQIRIRTNEIRNKFKQ